MLFFFVVGRDLDVYLSNTYMRIGPCLLLMVELYLSIIYLLVTYIYICYVIVGHGDYRSFVARAPAIVSHR